MNNINAHLTTWRESGVPCSAISEIAPLIKAFYLSIKCIVPRSFDQFAFKASSKRKLLYVELFGCLFQYALTPDLLKCILHLRHGLCWFYVVVKVVVFNKFQLSAAP